MKTALNRRSILLFFLFLVATVLVSVVSSYLLIKHLGYVRFVSEPRKDNSDYGYLEVAGNKYYQLYTTTEIKNKNVPPGSHIHAIDIRGGN